jgi:hypothetical protein
MSTKKSLSNALQRNAAAIQESQTSYQQSVLAVSNLMAATFAANLPAVNQQPANWDAIKTAYSNAKSDALSWTNQVYASLQSTPDSVESYNPTITALLGDAIMQAQALIADPGDATAKSLLNTDLKNLNNTLALVNIFITGTQSAIARFGTQTLTDDAAQLLAVANAAYQDQAIDQAAINQLKTLIDNLNNDIAYQASIIGVDGAALIGTAAVGVVCAAAFGPGDLILLGITMAVEAATISLASVALNNDLAQLRQAQDALGSTEQDAAMLQSLGDTFSSLAAQTVALSGAVDAISSAWQALETDVMDALTDINYALQDVAFTDYQSLYNDLVDASLCWQDAYAAAVLLEVKLDGNTADVAVGMTSDQVSQQLSQSPSIDFVTYINNFPQPVYA